MCFFASWSKLGLGGARGVAVARQWKWYSPTCGARFHAALIKPCVQPTEVGYIMPEIFRFPGCEAQLSGYYGFRCGVSRC